MTEPQTTVGPVAGSETPPSAATAGAADTAAAAAAANQNNGPGDEAPPPPAGKFETVTLADQKPRSWSRRRVVAAVMFLGSVIAACAIGVHRLAGSSRRAPDQNAPSMHDRPAAAAAESRRLELPVPGSPAASTAPGAQAVIVPGLVPAEDEVQAIAVQRTGKGRPAASATSGLPEDAPVLLLGARAQGAAPPRTAVGSGVVEEPARQPGEALAATSRNLQAYQQQLQGMLDRLTRAADAGAPSEGVSPLSAAVLSGAAQGLFGGQLPGSATPRAQAAALKSRSLTLPKGTAFTCALKTRVLSAASGLVGCLVQRDVYGDDGRVLLIERGSHLDGEYRITSVRPGMVRIPVLWTRVRTPLGVVVDIESPGTGPLGESGIEGHVDNRWSERIGAAMLLSLIDDAVKITLQNQGGERQGDTLVLPSTTSNTSKLAEKVLDSTINIPPLIDQHQGAVVGIYVARDVDFSSVYQLVPQEQKP